MWRRHKSSYSRFERRGRGRVRLDNSASHGSGVKFDIELRAWSRRLARPWGPLHSALIVNPTPLKHVAWGASRKEPRHLITRSALKPTEDIAADEPIAEAPFKACTAPARTMPAAFEDVARATVLVRTPKGFGSGFFLSPDGLVLTAAHVVDDAQLEVKQRDGSIVSAKAVRISRASDVALLVVHREGQADTPCLTPNLDAKLPGTEVYAIGAPAFQDLASSITRGIISGERDVHGTPLLQTDASVSPGNSGGPLVDSQGRAAAVVSRKLAGGGVDGERRGGRGSEQGRVGFGRAVQLERSQRHLDGNQLLRRRVLQRGLPSDGLRLQLLWSCQRLYPAHERLEPSFCVQAGLLDERRLHRHTS